jgi:transcriptional regulator with XRE-family HTH domain
VESPPKARETARVSTVAQCFTENLKRALAHSSLSQEQVAARAGIDRTQMTKLAKGTQVPRVDTMIRLEAALGLKRAALIEGIVWNPAVGSGGEFKHERSERKKGSPDVSVGHVTVT